MGKQKIRTGKGLVHTRANTKAQGSDRIRRLVDTYVTKPTELRRKLVDEWRMLTNAGVPQKAIAEEYNTSQATVSKAVIDPEEWVRRGTVTNSRSWHGCENAAGSALKRKQPRRKNRRVPSR